MSSPRAHLFAQDNIPWRGLGIPLLALGGCVFVALLSLYMLLSALRDALIWLVGPPPKDEL